MFFLLIEEVWIENGTDFSLLLPHRQSIFFQHRLEQARCF